MRVLIITYYWPPAGGSGVQRWLKFVKYFQNFGVEPIIYTPENADFPSIDESLLKEVPKNVKILKHPIKNPQDIVYKLKKKKENVGVANASKGGILSWIRGNMFIPDAKVFWVKPSVKFLKKYIQNNPVDLIISTGPPHSMHLIAQKVVDKTAIKWIADFRDPWTTIYYNKMFKMGSLAKFKHKALEDKVLQKADAVLTVSNTLANEFKSRAKQVKVITNGYDDEVLQQPKKTLTTKFTLSYIGLLPALSNPTILWKVLSELVQTNEAFRKDLEINLTGSINDVVFKEIKELGLKENMVFNGYVSHKEAIEIQSSSQVLLLLIPQVENSKGILTGKLFEYLAVKRPILAIGPTDGDLAEILSNTNSGKVVDYKNSLQLKEYILDLYNRFKEDKLVIKSKNIEKYHRKELTRELTQFIKEIVNN